MILPLGIRGLIDELHFVMLNDITRCLVRRSEVYGLVDLLFVVFQVMVSQMSCNQMGMRCVSQWNRLVRVLLDYLLFCLSGLIHILSAIMPPSIFSMRSVQEVSQSTKG